MKENPPENNEQNYPTLKTQTIKKTNTEQQKPKTDAKKQTEKEKHNQQDTEQEITSNQQQQEACQNLPRGVGRGEGGEKGSCDTAKENFFPW